MTLQPPSDQAVNKQRPEEQNVDRDGRERQPIEQDQEKLEREGDTASDRSEQR